MFSNWKIMTHLGTIGGAFLFINVMGLMGLLESMGSFSVNGTVCVMGSLESWDHWGQQNS
ncbi:hypothetical protein NQ318_007957 [Aromia moschata]|uniref:Uncharacterized protein n=1 Tax=Aromia moschata TaxID=1265417 RepID=A0AAV8YBH6_9CUCU|nr:hypothetical protein NQ318_007957 [Aromia moschata]